MYKTGSCGSGPVTSLSTEDRTVRHGGAQVVLVVKKEATGSFFMDNVTGVSVVGKHVFLTNLTCHWDA